MDDNFRAKVSSIFPFLEQGLRVKDGYFSEKSKFHCSLAENQD